MRWLSPFHTRLSRLSSRQRFGGRFCVSEEILSETFGYNCRHSAALAGRFVLGDVFPGLKPMGYSVFALRATQNVQTSKRQNSIVLCTGFQPWSFGIEEAPKFFLRPLSRNVQTPGHFVPG